MRQTRSAELGLGSATVVIAALAAVTFVAFLGFTHFYSKGEPREAVVAVAMLNQGDWVLPVSLGADIPYKPPLLAWCIAALGWLNGGVVTEYLSRLPSALAMVVMTVAVFRFFARRSSASVGALASVVMMTAFEVHRAATSCRVDMLLTACMVLALLEMYRHWERRGDTWLPSPWAALLMSGAVLTKGPVGMVLPCGVMFLFVMSRGGRFWPAVVSLGLTGCLSLVLPALWYVAAYHRGGEAFYRLAMEENVGRMTGTMTYGSHENPVWYNFLMLIGGMAPWTLLCVFALFAAAWRRFFGDVKSALDAPVAWWNGLWRRFRALDAVDCFALVAAVVVLVFYSIPKSKRGVYLLPMYPFMAYGLALLMRRMAAAARGVRVLRAFGWFVAGVSVLATVLLALLGWDAFDGIAPARLLPTVEAFSAEGRNFVQAALMFVPLAIGVTLMSTLRRGGVNAAVMYTAVAVLGLYWSFSADIQPAALAGRGDLAAAATVRQYVPDGERVYAFLDDPYARYYCLGYYLDDRVDHSVFEAENASSRRDKITLGGERPRRGYVLIPDRDVEQVTRRYGAEYSFVPVAGAPDVYSPTTKLNLQLFTFEKR